MGIYKRKILKKKKRKHAFDQDKSKIQEKKKENKISTKKKTIFKIFIFFFFEFPPQGIPKYPIAIVLKTIYYGLPIDQAMLVNVSL